MAYLYNNKDQQVTFNLLPPRALSSEECKLIHGAFKHFSCSSSSIIAEQTHHFNCIGWAIGVHAFLDPNKEINPHYGKKDYVGSNLRYTIDH